MITNYDIGMHCLDCDEAVILAENFIKNCRCTAWGWGLGAGDDVLTTLAPSAEGWMVAQPEAMA